jgi:hypothetical protein
LSAISPATLNSGQAMQQRSLRLLICLIIGWLPALLGRDAVAAAARLYPLAAGPHPYFVPEHALLLYVLAPIVAVSACILFLSPGLLLALALDAGTSVGRWVFSALALSLLVVSLAAGIVQALLRMPLQNSVFAAVVVVCALVSFAILVARQRNGYATCWPFSAPHSRFMALSMVIVPYLLLVALAPKFYWENFNGDGAHAFEAARLLLYRGLPFWPVSAGDVSSFPGVTSMLFAFPASWFIRLFGEFEVSARLPFLLYLAVLFGTLVELATAGGSKRKPLNAFEQGLVWLQLSVFAIVMAYSATYNPYSADIALPATQDTLLMVCFLGCIWAFVEQKNGWLLLFLALTFLSLPNGLMLLGLWLLAVVLVCRPVPWRPIALSIAGIALSMAVAALLPSVLVALGQPPPGEEYGLLVVLRWFAFLQWGHWQRIQFVVLAGGIVPALALFAWRRHDRVARALTLVTAGYFVFFYVQGYTILHHFMPTMILPLVVFWRMDLEWARLSRSAILAATAASGIVALVISLPRNWTVDTSARQVGMTIEDGIGGYDTGSPAAMARSILLAQLFPYDWDPSVPAQNYGGSPLAWNYYAHRADKQGPGTNYVLLATADPAPAGMKRVGETGGAALYVLDEAAWASHLGLRPPSPAGSPAYAIPRGMIFRSVPLIGGPAIISVSDLLARRGFDVKDLLDRMKISY